MRYVIVCLLCAVYLSAQTQTALESNRVLLPNGWSLTPVGIMMPLGDLPLNIAVSPRTHFLAVTNNGQSRQTLQLIDPKTRTILDSALIAKSWLGLSFSNDGRSLYASGGNDNWILRYDVRRKKLELRDTLRLGHPWPFQLRSANLQMARQELVLEESR